MIRRLEAIRGFAAVYVCLGHVGARLPVPRSYLLPLSLGQEMVICFFLLSGFVIQWSATRTSATEPFSQYFLKRFLRIYGVWIPSMLFLFLLGWSEHGSNAIPSARMLVGNILMLQDFKSGKPGVLCDPLFDDGPLWSLHYEWWFYMLFPLVTLIPGDDGVRRRRVIGVATVAASVWYACDPGMLTRLLAYFSIWWIGAEAAICLRRGGRIDLRSMLEPFAWLVLTAVPFGVVVAREAMAGTLSTPGLHPFLEFRHFTAACLLVAAAFVWRRLGWFGFKQIVGWGVIAAPISYSLYVIHEPTLADAHYLEWIGIPALEWGGYVLVTLGFCLAVEVWLYPHLKRMIFPRRTVNVTPADADQSTSR